MVYEFRLPDIGEGVAEGEVVKWFVEEGATVKEDAPLVSVLTDKANVEIPSPRTGRILKLHAAVGEKVKVGGLLVSIDAPAAPGASGSSPPGVAPSSALSVSAAPSLAPAGAGLVAPRVLATPAVRRIASEKSVDLSKVAGSGPLGRITETDIDRFLAAGAGATAPTVAPSSPPSSAVGEPSRPLLHTASSASGAGATERVPIRGLRRAIAEHMSESVHRAAHFTYVEEVDASELVRIRERMAKHVEKQGIKLSYLPFIVKAVVAGLRAHPWMNATMDDEHQELVVHRDYNIGIATAAPEGLIVPVLHHADRKSVTALAKEIAEVAERGRAGKLSREELIGGTFTITSLGALGGVLATPILNYPQVSILGVHRIVRRPLYRPDGTLAPADLMNLSVSLDHRVLDGIVGAQFLSVVKGMLEDPHQLFAELA